MKGECSRPRFGVRVQGTGSDRGSERRTCTNSTWYCRKPTVRLYNCTTCVLPSVTKLGLSPPSRRRHVVTLALGAMGKAKKNKKAKARFDPLARPAPSAMDAEGDDEEAAAPKLSAHQARHLERKRLQAERLTLKQQKRKVSKADKLAWQSEQRSLSKTLKTNKAALRLASSHSGVVEAAVPEEVKEAPSFTGFDLPAPRGGADAVGGAGAGASSWPQPSSR